MHKKMAGVVAGMILALGVVGAASADSDNAANGCNALGQERSSRAGEGGWGNGGEYPGIAWDARFGGTDIYGQYIKDWISSRCP